MKADLPQKIQLASVQLNSQSLPLEFNTLTGREIFKFADDVRRRSDRMPTDSEWVSFLSPDNMNRLLENSTKTLTQQVSSPTLGASAATLRSNIKTMPSRQKGKGEILSALLKKESKLAGVMNFLASNNASLINKIISDSIIDIDLNKYLTATDPLGDFDPR